MKRRPKLPERWRGPAAHGASFWETASRGASYNPLSPSVIQNPYKTYTRLRRYSPVHRSTILGSWVLTRYEDVLTAAKDHERFSNDPRWRRATTSVLPPAPDDYSILLVDPPEHSRLRKVVAEVFSRNHLQALNETIVATASELVERASKQRKIAHLAGAEIQRYFTALLRDRMQSTESDAVSVLARHAAEGDRISMVEACDMLMVLMIAGNETTTNLIGNGMLALLRHPEQMQLLREEPGRVRDAINEMLRFDSPVQTDFRIAKSQTALGRRTIKSGDGVILLTGSANRDETVFEHADTFDITRKGARHVSFGHGVHQCIGAELARLEASAIFTEVLRKLGTIELVGGEPRYRTSTVIRGLSALPLHVKGREPVSVTACAE